MNKYIFSKKYKIINLKFYKNFINKYNYKFTYYFNVYYNNNFLCYPRLGIIINKKYVKFSYKRNLIKRIIRESFRLNQFNIKNLDFIIISNSKLSLFKNNLIFNDLDKLWNFNLIHI